MSDRPSTVMVWVALVVTLGLAGGDGETGIRRYARSRQLRCPPLPAFREEGVLNMATTRTLDEVAAEVRAIAESVEKEPHRWRIVEVQLDCVVYQDDKGKLLFMPIPPHDTPSPASHQ